MGRLLVQRLPTAPPSHRPLIHRTWRRQTTISPCSRWIRCRTKVIRWNSLLTIDSSSTSPGSNPTRQPKETPHLHSTTRTMLKPPPSAPVRNALAHTADPAVKSTSTGTKTRWSPSLRLVRTPPKLTSGQPLRTGSKLDSAGLYRLRALGGASVAVPTGRPIQRS